MIVASGKIVLVPNTPTIGATVAPNTNWNKPSRADALPAFRSCVCIAKDKLVGFIIPVLDVMKNKPIITNISPPSKMRPKRVSYHLLMPLKTQ